MKFIRCSILKESHKTAVFDLWNKEYPHQLAYTDIPSFEKYLAGLTHQSHIILLDSNDKLVGWYFDFIRDNEKWFAIILDSSIHGKGIGTQFLSEVKKQNVELSGWVIDHNNDKKKNGDIYQSPLSFYLKNGFRELSDCRLETATISAVKIMWGK